jgi:hypothetical protein
MAEPPASGWAMRRGAGRAGSRLLTEVLLVLDELDWELEDELAGGVEEELEDELDWAWIARGAAKTKIAAAERRDGLDRRGTIGIRRTGGV